MGKKIRGKAHVRDTPPVEEKNVEDGLRKPLSRQARSEVSNLVEKLLKVCSNSLLVPNDAKEMEDHKKIEKLVEKIRKIESEMKIPVADRNAYFEEFTTWMKANGAEINGVKITWFEGYGYGIEAEKNFAQGDLLIAVPRKVMLTTENIGDSLLGPLFRTDPMLQHMPNVALSLLLLVEKFRPDSFWKSYIAVLPAEYTTVLYFKTNELLELKGSPTLEPALKQCRNIARQYAYFRKLFQDLSDPASELLREVFTYEQYCWAVSTVMTRQNFVPSSDGKTMLNALIPMWDMCNHSSGKLSTDFSAEQDRIECMACRDYQAAEQIFIFYGPRTNSEFFIHNGFVYPDNEHDGLRLRLGISREDSQQPQRTQLLGRLGIPDVGDFMLKKGPDPVDGRLLAFLRVFNMGQEHLEQWLSSDRSCDLVYPEYAVTAEVESKTWKYLHDRICILQRGYRTALDYDCMLLENPALTPCQRIAVQLRVTEKKILAATEDYVKQQMKA